MLPTPSYGLLGHPDVGACFFLNPDAVLYSGLWLAMVAFVQGRTFFFSGPLSYTSIRRHTDPPFGGLYALGTLPLIDGGFSAFFIFMGFFFSFGDVFGTSRFCPGGASFVRQSFFSLAPSPLWVFFSPGGSGPVDQWVP